MRLKVQLELRRRRQMRPKVQLKLRRRRQMRLKVQLELRRRRIEIKRNVRETSYISNALCSWSRRPRTQNVVGARMFVTRSTCRRERARLFAREMGRLERIVEGRLHLQEFA
jgi:hypothetical protein